jgi:type I restriction enzyme S subunit
MAVHAGELLLSGSATFGLPVIVPAEADGAIPYTGLIRVWPSSSCVEPAYLRLFFGSTVFADQVDRLKTGVAIQHWGPSHLGQVRFPMPPIESQRRLVKELEAEEHALHRLVELGDREIALLIERRQALITAAVTGQIEIPGVAA